jgi:hypothetical protein
MNPVQPPLKKPNETRRPPSRPHKRGDTLAEGQYALAATSYAIGTVAATISVFYPLLLGALGAAIVFALSGYYFVKLAEGNESSPLEKWARRCFFGKADEAKTIHWKTSEFADAAFAELNAATLGLQAKIEFTTKNLDPVVVSKIGRIEQLNRIKQLKFKLYLPGFDKTKAGYEWTVTIHRHGDGYSPHFTGGEIVASGKFHEPPHSATSSQRASLLPSKPPRNPDYKKESIDIQESVKTSHSENGLNKFNMQIYGSIEIAFDSGAPSINTATLSVAYWPDRAISGGYAEITLEGHNG